MMDLVNSPEMQTAVVPFAIALIVGLLLWRRYPDRVCAGVIPGFVFSALLINGFNLTPLTGTRKIILVAVLAYCVSLLFELFNKQSATFKKSVYLLAMLAALWVVWPLLGRVDNLVSGLIIAAGLLYVVLQVYYFQQFDNNRSKVIAGILSLGIATGASAILAASALYGQLSLAIVNAVVAILVLLIHSQFKTVSLLSYPASLLLGLLGLATMVFAELPWYTLAILVFIPVVVQTEFANRLIKNKSVFLATIILFFVAMLPAVVAVLSVWLTVEDTSY